MNINKINTIIIGAGPAGLACGVTLVNNNKDILVLEKEKQVGGISKTVEYKGYRFDLGGHRFFTKSREVEDLWNKTLQKDFPTRPRLSRIYYNNKFFYYPLKPFNALFNLGIFTSFSVLGSYVKIKIFPINKEKTFDQWVSNRFGKKLFEIFFETYTEKLWGIPCNQIQAEWAAQRIKGLSLSRAVKNALFPDKKEKIKTLIDKFKYPKYGPGMMYEKMADNINNTGSKVMKNKNVEKINWKNNKIFSVEVSNKENITEEFKANSFVSSMPISELVLKMNPKPPVDVLKSAKNLKYRSFIIISLILDKKECFPDNWVYIHSPEVKLGRIQNFKNWSIHMLKDKNKTVLGMEYFCNENDNFWNKKDGFLINQALEELEKIKLGEKDKFIDGYVARVPKAYPVYDEDYKNNLEKIKSFLNKFENLQIIGRNGMFKYNNMDHSILTGIYAAKNILGENNDLFSVNVDKEYHEMRKNNYNTR